MSDLTVLEKIQWGIIKDLNGFVAANRGSISLAEEDDFVLITNKTEFFFASGKDYLDKELGFLYERKHRIAFGAEKMFLFFNRTFKIPEEYKNKKLLFLGTLFFDKEKDPFVLFLSSHFVKQSYHHQLEIGRYYLYQKVSDDVIFIHY